MPAPIGLHLYGTVAPPKSIIKYALFNTHFLSTERSSMIMGRRRAKKNQRHAGTVYGAEQSDEAFELGRKALLQKMRDRRVQRDARKALRHGASTLGESFPVVVVKRSH